MAYETILVEQDDHVGVITLNRPKALNALNAKMLLELDQAVKTFDEDNSVGAIVIKGSEKAFAAGADIKEMQSKSYMDMYFGNAFDPIDRLAQARKPLIASVQGYALGGGCELALVCDIIYACPGAKFGLPEISLGVMPGMGGTQRLIRQIGKAKAMEMILTGRMMNAEDAERAGLVARIFDQDKIDQEAIATAAKISAFSLPSVVMAKATVAKAQEMGLSEGLRHERHIFQSMFALEDQKEGMQAFVDKRSANFIGK